MDATDRKILHAIAEDARASRKQLAKRVRVSREVFDYRIKRLEEQGIIVGYQARVNLQPFVYGGYILLVQAIRLTTVSEQHILLVLRQNPRTQYIGKVGGSYDYIIGCTVKSLTALSEYIAAVNTAFGEHKARLSVLTMVREVKDTFKTLFADADEHAAAVSMLDVPRPELDAIDKRLLKMLGRDGVISSVALAHKAGISDVAVRKRIVALEERQVILGYRTMIDLTALEQEFTFLLVKTNEHGPRDELRGFFSSDRKTTYACKTVGECSYITTCFHKDNKELNAYITALRDRFDIVTEVEALPLFAMLYHKQVSEDLFD